MTTPRRRSQDGPEPRECVVLVHGFLANTLMLTVLARRLRRRGYAAEIWGYRNMCCSLMVHAERFAAVLRRLDASPGVSRIHLVTHSMGCIIGRAALGIERPDKLGRFVMLAPPNRGSFVATAAAATFGRFFRPVEELTTHGDSLVNSLPMPWGVDIGVIAAGHDALVTEESTRPDVPHEHVTVPCLHSSLLFRRDAADLVAGFLRDGRFPGVATDAAHPTPTQAG
jgi:pimeloyl-ACP methyl ester carboxylesterase